MAEAILRGVLDANLAAAGDIGVGEPRPERCKYLSEEFGVHTHRDNLEAAQGADLVILAVKPQDLPAIFKQLGKRLSPDQAVLSIVAGAKMSTLTKGLDHASVIRVMPNTPAQIGHGMSMWTCSETVDETKRGLTQSVLATVGREIYVDD